MAWDYEVLFDVLSAATDSSRIWARESPDLKVGQMGYRTRTIKAGPRLEAEVYPIWGRQDIGKARAARQKASSEAVQRANEERSKRHLIQLMDANFTDQDLHVTLTYRGDPPALEQAQRDIRNFVARIRRLRKKQQLPDLKYIYILEDEQDGKKARMHTHMVLNGGLDRDLIESIWQRGYANCDRLRPNENGLEELARYLTKSRKKRRRWASSKNLKKPKERVSNTRLSKARIHRLARNLEQGAKEIMERVYPGYAFSSAKVFTSDTMPGIYIRAILRQKSPDVHPVALRKKSKEPVPGEPVTHDAAGGNCNAKVKCT